MLAFCSKEAARRFMTSKPHMFPHPDDYSLDQSIVQEKDGVILATPPAKVRRAQCMCQGDAVELITY